MMVVWTNIWDIKSTIKNCQILPNFKQSCSENSSKKENVENIQLCSVFLPISAFTDNLHLEVVDPAGGWDGVGGPDRRCILGGFAMTFSVE